MRTPHPVGVPPAEPSPLAETGTGLPQALAPAVSATEVNRPPVATRNPAIVVPGTGVFVAPTPVRGVTIEPQGQISFNFVDANVRDVVREVLGDQLHLPYVIDPKVQGTITAQTAGPLPPASVLSALETVLQANGLALVQQPSGYRIMAMDDAAKAGLAVSSEHPLQPGYAIRILPLHYVGAGELKSILDPFAPPGGVVQADATRNLLIITGPTADLNRMADLVHQFDVDWIGGTSFALYPLQVGSAKEVASELDGVFGQGGSGPLAGMVRIVPIERLNALLVITPQRTYLSQVKAWIDRLDYGSDQMTPRLFTYRVQNSRAADLAAVLTQLMGGQVKTVQPTTAPGTQQVQVGGLGGGGNGGGLGGGGLGGGGLGGGQQSSGMLSNSGPSLPPSIAFPGTNSSASRPTVGNATGQAQGTTGISGQALGTNTGSATEALGLGGGGGLGTGQGGESQLPLPPVRVVADEKNNALVIFARPRDYVMIEDIIKRLDIVPLQVSIEAVIAEVTLNDALQYGLQFYLGDASSAFQLVTSSPVTTSTTSASGATTTTPASNIGISNVIGAIPGFNYVFAGGKTRAILSALASITHVNVISSPHVLVLDHQTAALQVGNEVPIITESAQSTLTSGSPILNSVDYRNTGVVLKVTPRVNTSGLITLDIDQEVSDVATTTSSQIDSPTISERRIISSVVVQDGQTVALGGLIQQNVTRQRSGIPVLKDIPYLGALFSNTSNSRARTELLVLLSPRIIRNALDARAMTDDLRERLREIKPLNLRHP